MFPYRILNKCNRNDRMRKSLLDNHHSYDYFSGNNNQWILKPMGEKYNLKKMDICGVYHKIANVNLSETLSWKTQKIKEPFQIKRD